VGGKLLVPQETLGDCTISFRRIITNESIVFVTGQPFEHNFTFNGDILEGTEK
jgi:hypothetical protein